MIATSDTTTSTPRSQPSRQQRTLRVGYRYEAIAPQLRQRGAQRGRVGKQSRAQQILRITLSWPVSRDPSSISCLHLIPSIPRWLACTALPSVLVAEVSAREATR